MSVVLYKEPKVDIIQLSNPQVVTLTRLTDDAAFPDIHDFEPDASNLEIVPIFAGRACYQSFGSKAGRKTAEDYLGHILDVGHYSILEHSSVSFYIQGVSRSFSHEMVRHRIASYSQLSQRFVAYDEVMPIVIHPNALEACKTSDQQSAVEDYYLQIGLRALEDYRSVLAFYEEAYGTETFAQKKKARETAREILPTCVETKMVVTMNLRALLEFFLKRDADGADGQIRLVASKMHELMRDYAPNVFRDE